MTGFISTIEITSTVTSSMTESELDEITSQIISSFDVSDDDIRTTGNTLEKTI